MIVVDTNIIAYLLIRGERSERIDRLQSTEPQWVAPRLWLDEFISILCTCERKGSIDSRSAVEILEDALTLMDGQSYELPPERVLATARRTGCSGYDSQYIALAEDLGVKLYTCDRGILSKCPELALLPE